MLAINAGFTDKSAVLFSCNERQLLVQNLRGDRHYYHASLPRIACLNDKKYLPILSEKIARG
jgi:hypothetical protein